ncbi:MAG TPA: hypothetical protein VHE78_06265 [Gemmatimonadaceae bacterium]|nr:hypothetical protein [Gemmatimonadaceae bacterium]
MKVTWPSGRLVVGSYLSVASMACGSVTGSKSAEFTIAVDSITGPTAVSGGGAFESRLWGVVGPSGCYRFKELRTTRVPAQIDVTVIGELMSGVACTQVFVTLGGVTLRVEPIIPNDFRIVVHQPNGSTLVRRIAGE